MATVAITGGTGALGRALVPLLAGRDHEVRAVSREDADVRTGAGLAEAFAAADVVVHAASSARRDVHRTELAGTANVLRAAAGRHVVYLSVVGSDRSGLGYHRAKREGELLVERHPGPWTIQRATQFHEFVDSLLGGPVFVRTPNLAFQPVAAADVADAVVGHVEHGPAGRAPDAAGPEVLTVRELAAIRRDIVGRAAKLVPMPALGPLRHLDAGHHLAPEAAGLGTTWADWLARRAEPPRA